MDLAITCRLKDDTESIRRRIGNNLAAQLNVVLKEMAKTIQYKIRIAVRRRIMKSPTFMDLFRTKGGSEGAASLRVHLGLERPTQILFPIIRKWLRSVVVKPITIKYSGGKFHGGLEIELIQNDWGDVLRMDEATYISVSRNEYQRLTAGFSRLHDVGGNRIEPVHPSPKPFLNQRGTTTLREIPWLAWLLLRGSAPIVQGYEMVFGNFPTTRKLGQHMSRTGKAIMVPKPSGFWRMPVEHAGTTDNNFVTRALEGIDIEIEQIVRQTAQHKFG